MSAFEECLETEREGMRRILPLLQAKSCNGQFVLTTKGRLSPFLQTTVGDFLVNIDPETVVSGELKTERRCSPNLFLETWSNKRAGRKGWMFTLDADFLFYYFLESDDLYVLPFPALCCWFEKNLKDFQEVEQRRYEQPNDTWGRLVPIARLEREVSYKHCNPWGEFLGEV